MIVSSTLLLTFTFTYLLHRPSNRIVMQWQQPESIRYDQFEPYYFKVVEADIDWKYFPFQWQRHYYIYVGRESGVPTYGHYLEFSFHPEVNDLETHLKRSQVEWLEQGVRFNEASGHQLFIPEELFTGGR